jgi:quercetin dioxygenase-like cupin family protein
VTVDPRTIVLQPGEGKTVSVLGEQYTYKAVGADTGGAYGLVETTAPARSAGPPPHIHQAEDEAFYVLEGELTVLIGDQVRKAAAGTFAFVPRGSVHTVSNPADRPARALVILSPAGFEQAFAEMSAVMPRADTPPDMERLMAIAQKYNLEIVGPPPER